MENIIQAVSDGTIITIVGMAVVFAFLTSAIVRYLNKKFPPKVVEAPVKKKSAAAGEEEAIAVAIAAVLNMQRSGR